MVIFDFVLDRMRLGIAKFRKLRSRFVSALGFHYLCSINAAAMAALNCLAMNLSEFTRRKAHDVHIGGVTIGSAHPVAVQSMTNTPTADTEASVAQCERIADAGAGIVRLTAQGRREGENLGNIVRRLRGDGYATAVVADIHFVPEVASIAARYVDKVRINPGNYRTSHGELEALVAQCRERGVALRIGVNHGSLARRVFDEWGDTPQGMVVSAMEFLRVCRREGFDEVVVSMK